MEAVSYSVSMALFAVILTETAVGVRARRAIAGSRERYVALTQRRLLSWVVNIGFFVQGVLGIAQGETLGFVSLGFAVWLAYAEIKNHKDDDDWFKGRGKKIWKGVKSGLAKLRPKPIHLPSPVPSPVFG